MLSEALADTSLRVPNPPAMLVLSIVLSAFQGGMLSGLLSAGIAWGYIAHFFAEPASHWTYSDDNLRRVIVWAVAMPSMAALVGLLKRRSTRLRMVEALRTSLEGQLAERSRTAAELTARAGQQAMVAELGRMALSGQPLPDLFARTVALIAERFDVPLVAVLECLPGADGYRMAAGIGWADGIAAETLFPTASDRQAGFRQPGAKVEVVAHLAAGPRPLPQVLRDHAVISGMSVDIGDFDRPFGVLALYTTESRGFSPEDATSFQAVANILAVAIQRTQSEERLHRATAHLANVSAISPAVLYSLQICGDDLVPTWISENVATLGGCSLDDALSAGWWRDHIHPEDLAVFDAKKSFSGGSGARMACEYRLLPKEGTTIWVHDEMRVLRDENGTPREIVGAWIDVTERRQTQEQVLQTQKMETVGRLAGGVAHDFNNLLLVITSTVDLALAQPLTDDHLRADLNEIRRAAERASVLTRQLLAFSRRQILRPEVLNLNDTPLAEMETMLPRLLGENIRLVIERDPQLGNVMADPGQLAQIVMNLAVNSRDAMPSGGELRIETENVDEVTAADGLPPGAAPGPYVALAVSDTGQGMDEATRRRIFEPFFTTKSLGHGTGLGLATVYGIVQQSGGHITVHSEVGRGSTFRIYLPRVPTPVFVMRPPPPAEPPRGEETILVVEDEGAVRKLTKRVLERAGFKVLTAENGEQATRMIEKHGDKVHLMLTDVVMPGIGGPELADRLRERWPAMKVLFMSGYTEHAVLHRTGQDGDAAFIGKPFDMAALTRKVRDLLDAPI